MKKITFVIGTMGNGGAERVISILANHFSRKDYIISVITIYGNKQDYKLNKNINYYPIICNKKNKIKRIIERMLKIRSVLREIDSEVIISFLADVNIYVLLANLFLKGKVIVSERNDPTRDPKNKYIRKLRDLVYNLSDGFVFQTYDAKSYFRNKFQEKSIIISNPLKGNLPLRYEGARDNRIVTACRLNTQKNLYMLINAFKKFQDIYEEYILEIYGEGPLKNELIKYIESIGLGNKVILKGFSSQIHEDILSASIFVISSDYEGISNAMIEALAIGLPVISTDSPVGGARMFIDSYKNGILVPVKDTEALYAAMVEIVDDKNLQEQLSHSATFIREKLDESTIVSEWENYITKV